MSILAYWTELVAAAVVGFTAGVIVMGMFMKSVRNAAMEDRIIRALQEQALQDRLAEKAKSPPKE